LPSHKLNLALLVLALVQLAQQVLVQLARLVLVLVLVLLVQQQLARFQLVLLVQQLQQQQLQQQLQLTNQTVHLPHLLLLPHQEVSNTSARSFILRKGVLTDAFFHLRLYSLEVIASNNQQLIAFSNDLKSG
jgi:hypothetical protein